MRRGAGTSTSIPRCRARRWMRAPTSACSPRTSWRAASSRRDSSTGAPSAWTASCWREAYREYVTTSPSYGLLASADAAVRALEGCGERLLDEAIARTERLKAGLRVRLPDLDHLDDPRWLDAVGRHIGGCDLV